MENEISEWENRASQSESKIIHLETQIVAHKRSFSLASLAKQKEVLINHLLDKDAAELRAKEVIADIRLNSLREVFSFSYLIASSQPPDFISPTTYPAEAADPATLREEDKNLSKQVAEMESTVNSIKDQEAKAREQIKRVLEGAESMTLQLERTLTEIKSFG